jgi:hypothetical protein
MALTPWRRAHLLTTTVTTPILVTDIGKIPRPDNHQLRRREGDTAASRVAYTAIALVCMSLLAGMFGKWFDFPCRSVADGQDFVYGG